MKKKILIVSKYFYPTNNPRSLRTTELVKEFARQGHDVTIITPKDNNYHPKFEKTFGIKIKPLGKISFNNVSVNNPTSGKFFIVKKYLYLFAGYFFDYPNILGFNKTLKSLQNENGYDLMITIAVPHMIHWATSFIQTKNIRIAKTWLGDCGDPFMGIKNGKFKRPVYFKFFEKKWCNIADFIVVPFEGAKNGYYPEFQNKIKVIPQGFYFPEINRNEPKNKTPTFIYSGSIHPYKHYYEPFFEFLQKTSIKFKFIIFSKTHSLIKEYTKGIENKITLNNYVDREELLKYLVKADFLLHFPYIENKQKSLKLVDYHYSKIPILSYKGAKDNDILGEFLIGNYKNKLQTENIDQYKIKNVCNEFLKLGNL